MMTASSIGGGEYGREGLHPPLANERNAVPLMAVSTRLAAATAGPWSLDPFLISRPAQL